MLLTDKYAGFFRQVHGGYLSGLLAREIGSSAEVVLRRPVATGSEVTFSRTADRVELKQAGTLVAEGASRQLALVAPQPIDFTDVLRASEAYPGFERHLFPDCFCCGPDRAEGDGLRIFPGPVTGRKLAAAPWVPHHAFADSDGNVLSEILWAALDCPALWSLVFDTPADSEAQVVTGTIAMRIDTPVKAGQRHMILAWPIGAEGRKVFAGAALYNDDGAPVAAARQVCVLFDRGVPLGRSNWARAAAQRTSVDPGSRR